MATPQQVIDAIMADCTSFRQNAVRCYEEIWRPDRYLAAIAERLRQISA